MSFERTFSRIDVNLLTTALLIAGIGCVLVYSATYFGPDAPLFRRQVIWTGIGIVLMLIFTAIDYHVMLEVSPFLYGIGLALLVYVLVWGRLTRHVKSWIHIGSFQFQPAEFMKIFTALMIAKYFDSNDHAYLNLRSFVVVMAIIGVPMVLIAAQPAFGSAAAFLPLVGVAMFFGGIKPKIWLIAILCGFIALPVLHGTQVNLEYLPARHTDFIFSVLGEEWGFVGVLIVLTLYLFLIIESLSVAKASRDRGGTFLVLSLICFFVFHIFINVAMQIGLLPVTGIPLPLISYGGSATLMFFVAIGLILNVDFRKFVNV